MILAKDAWIEKAYELCATNGLKSLKVEQLAKSVGISKSSFYHHFADLECFREALYNYHLHQCSTLAEKEKVCTSIRPELINVLVEHRIDLLFHRQLRINRNEKSTAAVLQKSIDLLGDYAVLLWAKEINLNMNQAQLHGLFTIATDDFYMQINEGNITHDFLSNYFEQLSKVAQQFV